MEFTLRKPPTINRIYAYSCITGHAKSYITAEGRTWFEESGYLLKSAINAFSRGKRDPHFPLTENVTVLIKLYTCMHQDIDNILKPILDLMTKSNLITDDSIITLLTVEKVKVKHKNEEKIEVEVY